MSPLKTATMLLCLAVLGGCRPNLYKLVEVKGIVTTCEGKPAAGGAVVFYPIDDPAASGRPAGNPGREARGIVGADGTFALTSIGMPAAQGAVSGRHKIAFEMPPTQRPTLPAGERANMTPEEIKTIEADLASRPVYPLLPCSDKIEPAEVTVTAGGPNHFEFKLPPR